MTAGELLSALRGLGVTVRAEGDNLRLRGPAGAVLAVFRDELVARKAELLALLRGPPPGARLFFQRQADAKVCWPDEAEMWSWERGPQWFYTKDRPVPPCEPAVCPRYFIGGHSRCGRCVRVALRVVWQTCKGGEQRLRVECQVCGGFVGWLALKPDNPALEWRKAG
jgi:hypothetical protein